MELEPMKTNEELKKEIRSTISVITKTVEEYRGTNGGSTMQYSQAVLNLTQALNILENID